MHAHTTTHIKATHTSAQTPTSDGLDIWKTNHSLSTYMMMIVTPFVPRRRLPALELRIVLQACHQLTAKVQVLVVKLINLTTVQNVLAMETRGALDWKNQKKANQKTSSRSDRSYLLEVRRQLIAECARRQVVAIVRMGNGNAWLNVFVCVHFLNFELIHKCLVVLEKPCDKY